MIKINNKRWDSNISASQAANGQRGLTTEHVFGAILEIESTISSKNRSVYFAKLDMSKAFGSRKRPTLFKDLKVPLA